MNKEKAKRLLESVSPAYKAVTNAVDEALGPDGDGKFTEKDPFVRLVLTEAENWLERLRLMLLKEAKGA